ncbi:MAG: hypothetical protein QXO15_00945 [Nitrososphaerota archaeon]
MNQTAQLIGLIAHEYGYTLDYIASLTLEQILFLSAWLEWFHEKTTGRVKHK